jgi:asparagine synthase (glutamine-hydrolysing)
MSAQAGAFYFDGRPIESGFVRRIVEWMDEFGPDGGGQVVLPGVAMVYRGLHVTPEDRYERQPFRSRRGHILTWDGRLDNRDDLLLQLWREIDDDKSDAALAMASYEKWGSDGFGRLIGDWSLALWDATTRELKLASDYAGNRGLYYWDGDGEIHWSTSLGELVERVGLRDQLEPRFVVGYLTFSIPRDLTPYKGILSVSTAHALTWSAGKPKQTHRFWDLSIDSIQYRDSREYEARLRSLLGDAIRGRLRSTRPAWAELSGGLDSSTVVCMADRLLQVGASAAPSLETISYVTETSPESDESPFIAAVEAQRSRRSHIVKAEACIDVVDEERGWVTPLHPAGVSLEFFRTVRQAAGRVLLSGHPGDLVMGNYPESGASLGQRFAARQPRAFLSAARAWSRASRRPIWHVPREVLAPYLPLRARTRRIALEMLHPGSSSRDVMAAATDMYLLTPQSVDSWWDERLRRTSRVMSYGNGWQYTLIEGVVEYSDLRTFQSPSELPHIVHTHAYTDRRVVEFILAVPPEVLNPPGQPRRLMKAAFGCVLPPKVAKRFSKGYVDPLKLRKVRAWSPVASKNIDALFVVRDNFVDRRRLRAKLQAACDGSCRALGNVENILKFERWLDSRRATEPRRRLVAS